MDLELKVVGDECLREVSKPIDNITSGTIDLSIAMKEKMIEWKGVGLSAPQVGHNIRLIVVQLSTGQIQAMVNPRISWTSDTRVKMEEGCLSIPDEFEWIERPEKIRVKFQDITGQHKYWKLSKMDARVVLHEYDHLEGRLMTDYLTE